MIKPHPVNSLYLDSVKKRAEESREAQLDREANIVFLSGVVLVFVLWLSLTIVAQLGKTRQQSYDELYRKACYSEEAGKKFMEFIKR